MKFISVIIPAYNSGSYLLEAIESAVKQEGVDLEIIIVNDGSNDVGSKYIQRCAECFPKVRLVYQANQGLSEARNYGVRIARGQYLAFLDHDDVWRPTFLRTLTTLLEAGELGGAFSAIEHINHQGQLLKRVSRPKTTNLSVGDFLLSDPVGCGSSFVVTQKAFHSVGGFDANLRRAETPDFFIRLISAGWVIRGTAVPLVFYRNTPGSLSGGFKLAIARNRVFYKTITTHQYPGTFNCLIIWIRMHFNLIRIQIRRIYNITKNTNR